MLDRLLSFIFGIRKSYKISEKETSIINRNTNRTKEKKEIVNIDDVFTSKQNHKDLLFEIHEEALLTYEYDDYYAHYALYYDLSSVNYLFNQHRTYKKYFLYYLIKQIKVENKSTAYQFQPTDKVPINFKLELIGILLKQNLKFENEDFIYLLNKWKVSYPYQIPLKTIRKQLKKYALNNTINDLLEENIISFLRATSIRFLYIDEYMDTVADLKRIIHDKNHSYFKLLEDSIGTYTNKEIEQLDFSKRAAFRKILHYYYDRPTKQLPQELKIDAIVKPFVNTITIEQFNHVSTKLFKKAAEFKSDIVILRTHQKNSNGHNTHKHYMPVYKENLNILCGLVLLAGIFKNVVAIPYLVRLTPKCFMNAAERSLGLGSRMLGKTAIYVLAHHLGEEGKKALKTLYKETKYKRVKAQIEKESKNALQWTRSPLL